MNPVVDHGHNMGKDLEIMGITWNNCPIRWDLEIMGRTRLVQLGWFF